MSEQPNILQLKPPHVTYCVCSVGDDEAVQIMVKF
jgi:hypothetical protein